VVWISQWRCKLRGHAAANSSDEGGGKTDHYNESTSLPPTIVRDTSLRIKREELRIKIFAIIESHINEYNALLKCEYAKRVCKRILAYEPEIKYNITTMIASSCVIESHARGYTPSLVY